MWQTNQQGIKTINFGYSQRVDKIQEILIVDELPNNIYISNMEVTGLYYRTDVRSETEGRLKNHTQIPN